ncbi:MAG: hypothetical protein HY054_14715 [Proteobacteria bacterium]|nr:hypothetical protein [Pseudomonadota bacterium]
MEIQLFESHFQIYDDRFDYSSVSRIHWLPQTATRRFYYVIPIGVKRWFELTIEFVSGHPVQLGPRGFSSDLGADDFRSICEGMQALLAATRDLRLAKYREELERTGAFEYDDKMFFLDGTVERNGRRYALDLKTLAKAIDTHTEIKCLPRGSIEVKTYWDRDCFHILLNDLHRRHSTP